MLSITSSLEIDVLILGRPSGFVLSEEGKKVQKQIWKETIELLKKEAPNADLGEFATVTPV